jgi:gas vesicle protein
MRISRTKTTSLIGALAITGLLLTGCAGGQSKADACKVLESGLTDLQGELTSSLSDAATDPEGASEALQTVSDKFSDNVSKVSNDDVKDVADDADEALSTLVSEFKTYAADPTTADTTALTDASTDVQETFTELSKVCS